MIKVISSTVRKSGFYTSLEEETISNENYRKVIYTAKHSQLVLMSLQPDEEIGEEVHEEGDQFIRIDKGDGQAIIGGNKYTLHDGDAVIIPAGTKHNIINTGKAELKLYSVYSPPHHKKGTIHKTKNDQTEESFDGETDS